MTNTEIQTYSRDAIIFRELEEKICTLSALVSSSQVRNELLEKEVKDLNAEFEARICNLTSRIDDLSSNRVNTEHLNDKLEKFIVNVSVETSETKHRLFETKDLLQKKLQVLPRGLFRRWTTSWSLRRK